MKLFKLYNIFETNILRITIIVLPMIFCRGNEMQFLNGLQVFQNNFLNVVTSDLSNLTRAVLNKDTIGFVTSPFYAYFVLLHISSGAYNYTLNEIDNVLQLNLPKIEKNQLLKYFNNYITTEVQLKLNATNLMFIRDDIELVPKYEKDIELFFSQVHFKHTNISVATMFNNIMRVKINNRLKDVFLPEYYDNSTALVFGNFITFKGNWLYPPTVLNNRINFTQLDGKFPLVMYRINGIMKFVDLKKWKTRVVEIPFKTDDLAMLIFVPYDIDGYKLIENCFKNLLNITKLSMEMTSKPVAITLPNFSLESTAFLPTKLIKLGITSLFNENADLRRMMYNKHVKISGIVQRIKLWANAGRGAFKDTGDVEYPTPKVKLIADHPFMFVLKKNLLPIMVGHFYV